MRVYRLCVLTTIMTATEDSAKCVFAVVYWPVGSIQFDDPSYGGVGQPTVVHIYAAQ